MRSILNMVARYIVLLLAGFALAVLIGTLAEITGPQFWDLTIAIEIILLILFHVHWLLGLKRAPKSR